MKKLLFLITVFIFFILVLELSFVSADICYWTTDDNANNSGEKIPDNDTDVIVYNT